MYYFMCILKTVSSLLWSSIILNKLFIDWRVKESQLGLNMCCVVTTIMLRINLVADDELRDKLVHTVEPQNSLE